MKNYESRLKRLEEAAVTKVASRSGDEIDEMSDKELADFVEEETLFWIRTKTITTLDKQSTEEVAELAEHLEKLSKAAEEGLELIRAELKKREIND